MMHTTRLIVLALLLVESGCHSTSHRADPSWKADFDRAAVLRIGSPDGFLDVTDSSVVERLSNIYANAKWDYCWHTTAVYPEHSLILLNADGTELRTFRYDIRGAPDTFGPLWEVDDREGVRTAELADADQSWIDSLLASLPESGVTDLE